MDTSSAYSLLVHGTFHTFFTIATSCLTCRSVKKPQSILTKVNIANKALRFIELVVLVPNPMHCLIHWSSQTTYWICWSSLVSTSTVFDWHNRMCPEKSYKTDHKRQHRPYGEWLQELNFSVNLFSLSSMRLFMDVVFLFKCIIGLYDVDVSTHLVTADCSRYNRRHANYQFKIRYARTNALKFSYFFSEANHGTLYFYV